MLTINNWPTPVNYTGSTWITDEMRALVAHLNSRKVSWKLNLYTGLIPGDYYVRDSDGRYGTPLLVKPPYPKEIETLCINFMLSNEEVDKKRMLLNDLNATIGPIVETKEIDIRMGVYARPGFEEAWIATEKLVGSLTRHKFSQYGGDPHGEPYNLNLVEKRLYTDDVGLIMTFSRKTIQKRETGLTKLSLSILNSDIEKYTDRLAQILE